MQADQWEHIQDLYLKALAIPKPNRTAFLSAACRNDPGVVKEVESLLKYADNVEEVLGGYRATLLEALKEVLLLSR
jgi:hypothetical protein